MLQHHERETYIVERDLPDGRTRAALRSAARTFLPSKKRRDEAKIVLADFYKGVDPKTGRRGEATLGSALDDFPGTRRSARPVWPGPIQDSVEGHLASWLDKPLRNITRGG